MHIEKVSVFYQRIDQLKPYPHNARTHAKHQIRQIAESIRAFGFTNPVLVDAENQIIAGHGRVEAAKLLGMQEVPTIRLDRLTKEQIRAYVIADNKLAENAGWDKEILAIEIADTCFHCRLRRLRHDDHRLRDCRDRRDPRRGKGGPQQGRSGPGAHTSIRIPSPKPGDLWLLGKHRIIVRQLSARRHLSESDGQSPCSRGFH